MARSRVTLTPSQLVTAERRRRAGVPVAKIAAELGTNRRTLERRLAEANDLRDEPDTADRAIDVDTDLDASAGRDLKALVGDASLTPDELRAALTRIAAKQEQIADELTASGELDQARKAHQLAVSALNVLRASSKGVEPGTITLTEAELKAAADEAEAVLNAQSACRPNLCAHCSRELSISWGEGR